MNNPIDVRPVVLLGVAFVCVGIAGHAVFGWRGVIAAVATLFAVLLVRAVWRDL